MRVPWKELGVREWCPPLLIELVRRAPAAGSFFRCKQMGIYSIYIYTFSNIKKIYIYTSSFRLCDGYLAMVTLTMSVLPFYNQRLLF